ncbi:hypothetical protein [Geminocystis herdmanii]|uniref:hypothetical protein n=1 Tax=Geminocystis herdmanii TaxID=669359 RepID=UPI000347BC25|nr:hypothetical protein [Geminocystis herdmanii]
MKISLLFKILCLLLITLTPSVVMAENPPKRDQNISSTPPKTLTLKPNATEGYAPKMRQNSTPKINANIEHIPANIGHIPANIGHIPANIGHIPANIGHIPYAPTN